MVCVRRPPPNAAAAPRFRVPAPAHACRIDCQKFLDTLSTKVMPRLTRCSPALTRRVLCIFLVCHPTCPEPRRDRSAASLAARSGGIMARFQNRLAPLREASQALFLQLFTAPKLFFFLPEFFGCTIPPSLPGGFLVQPSVRVSAFRCTVLPSRFSGETFRGVMCLIQKLNFFSVSLLGGV